MPVFLFHSSTNRSASLIPSTKTQPKLLVSHKLWFADSIWINPTFLHVVLQSRTIHATLWQLFSGNSIYSTSQEYFINSCFHCVFWSQALWRTVSFLFLMLQHSELLATYTNANKVWLTRLLLPVIRLTLHSIKAPLILKHRPAWMGSRVPSLDGFMNSAAYYRSRLSKHTSHPCITITAIQRVTWPGQILRKTIQYNYF